MSKELSFQVIVISVAFVIILLVAIFFMTVGRGYADQIMELFFNITFGRRP